MSQWYESNRQLYEKEIEYITQVIPDAKCGFLSNGNMYWIIKLYPYISGQRKIWTFRAVYDSDYPHNRVGGSVKFYPLKPNYNEMMDIVNHSKLKPNFSPYLFRNEKNQVYPDVLYREKGKKEFRQAGTYLKHIMRWVTIFELALIDQEVCDLFNQKTNVF